MWGVDTVQPADGLEEKLALGRPLRIKLGLDPTAPAVTLGWAVVLRKLRHFQELGHTAVLIVGDFTAQVGDPSGKSATRKRLSKTEVDGFAERLLDQFAEILLPDNLEIRYNSEWLSAFDMYGMLELTSKATVAQMLERSDFSNRYDTGSPISVMEFMYPLLQGYDSVAVEADVELGGTDQLWNLMMGRSIQQRYGADPQVALTMPLLVGTDGVEKMSQSLGNYIGITDSPEEMFGKTMSIPDEAMPQWFVKVWWTAPSTLVKPSACWGVRSSSCTTRATQQFPPSTPSTSCSDAARYRMRSPNSHCRPMTLFRFPTSSRQPSWRDRWARGVDC